MFAKGGFLSTNKLELVMGNCNMPTTELGIKAIIAEIDPKRSGKISLETFF